MRLLVVNWQDRDNPQAGGAEIHLQEILSRLAARGHGVTLLCSGWEGAAVRAESDGIVIHRVGKRYSFPLHARRFYRENLAAQRFDVIMEDINKVPLNTPRWSATPVAALVPHLFGTTAFSELPAPMAAAVWLAERSIPRVYRGVPFHAISRSTADDLVARGIPPELVTVIYPGVDSDHYTPSPGERSEAPLFAYLGRHKKYKGVDLIIRAFADGELGGARLEIAGGGDYTLQLKALVSELGLQERVVFTGFLSEQQKLHLLRRAWALLFTSPKEGWGMTNLEAAACGTPVIASDSPGLRESVRGGDTGLLVPHGDVRALRAAMVRVAGDAGLVDKMGSAARTFAVDFSWERTALQTEQHLRGSIEQRQRAAN